MPPPPPRSRRLVVAGALAWAVANAAASPEPSIPSPARPFDPGTSHGDWPAYGGDLGARKYSPLDQIDADNVDDLRVAWVWEAFDNHRIDVRRGRASDGFKATPLMADGKLFVRTAFSGVAALDPMSGETLWTYDPGTGDGPNRLRRSFATRGVGYHRGAAGDDRLLLATSDGWLVALAPDTGKPFDDFGENGRVDLTLGLRRPIPRRGSAWSPAPAVCGDVVVVGNSVADLSHFHGANWRDNVPLGDVRGFHARTGEQLWTFRTVPQPGDFGNDTWGKESWRWMGNTNVWGDMSCDPELGHVYLPVSAPTSHFYGGLRPGDNLFGSSLVAVDLNTGERAWHFQTVRHDIWDYDLAAAPVVADIVMGDRPVRAVAQVTKTGFVYVFDRVTGAPLWPVEQRPAPPSDLAGEAAAETQPFPTWPPPFERQGLGDDDLIDLTPWLREVAKRRVEGLRRGFFAPPSRQGTIALPGKGGGASWGGAAFDPQTRMLYVASRPDLSVLTARKINAERFGFPYRIQSDDMRTIGGLPVVKPPWATITAYRLDDGAIAWQVANGAGPRDHPLLCDLDDLPDLGVPGNAPGLLLTKTLLFHGHRESAEGPSALRALDKATGAFLGERALQGTHVRAPPMTYLAGGKQYVVIATGLGWEPARLTAFRLP